MFRTDTAADVLPISEQNYLAAKLALISSMTFLGVSYGLITLLWFFMLSDTLLGIWKAVVLGGFSAVSKTKFWSGVGTKIAILFIPLSLALTGALAGYDLNIFVLTTMWTLIGNDAVSCYTNLLSIKRRKNYVNKDLVVLLINALRALIYQGVKRAIEKINTSDVCSDEPSEDDKGLN
jgi:hypothetical protein